ncbi:hypothetical protein ACCO45_005962 [Purpureocillium lilacinum]|uniref:Uncharacterized protein n=1 Tax=Purpureocillium lilacinum TaxID=33203 RepID=A0ACC4DZP8_PURLI
MNSPGWEQLKELQTSKLVLPTQPPSTSLLSIAHHDGAQPSHDDRHTVNRLPRRHRAQQQPAAHVHLPVARPSTNAFAPIRTPLQFSLLLSSTIDVFDLRAKQNAAAGVGLSGDVGLLHAVDDRLAAYGFETNTGVRMVCVVDMRGRRVDAAHAGSGGSVGGAGGAGGAMAAGSSSPALGGGGGGGAP